MVWKASSLQACEAIGFSAARILVTIKKGLRGPFFFRNQLLVGKEYKCAIHRVLSIPPLSRAFVCAHVVS
jgi:hypothetical protein